MQIISWRQAGWRMPPPEHGGMHTHIYVCRERRTNRKHNASGSIREDTHPFNGPLSRTTRVSRNQKCKANMDFTEARDSEWQWHQLGHMQVCISIQTDNHASTELLRFLQAGCPSCRPANSVKALKAQGSIGENIKVKSADNYWRVVRVIEIGGTSVRTSAVYDITVRVRFQLVRVRVVLQLPCCIPGTIATAAAAAAYHCNVTAMCNLIPASE